MRRPRLSDFATATAILVAVNASPLAIPPGIGSTAHPAASAEALLDPPAIIVDQFGYLPDAAKVAVITGERSAAPNLEVRRVDATGSPSGEAVFSGSADLWNDGAVDVASGDRGWRFDFSSLDDEGSYVVIDVETGAQSDRFEIAADVYDELLDTALRVFFLNRANVSTITGGPSDPWAAQAALLGPGQDGEARWVDDPTPETARDLSGGWYDAGDTNKYVTFAAGPVHQLISAYEASPHLFDDAVGITESGNGVPDILDEVRWELEWVERMQNDDGGVLLKVGFTDWEGAPLIEDDVRPRFYEEACSSSTIAAAGMFAAGARVFSDIDPIWAAELEDRAIAAWEWAGRTEWRDDCDPQIVHAGDADRTLDQQRDDWTTAAIHLFALTGEARFADLVGAGLARMLPFVDSAFGRYAPEQALAIELYRDLPTAEPSLVAAIDERVVSVQGDATVHGAPGELGLFGWFLPEPQFHWGSNMVMANTGNANLALARLTDDPPAALADRAGAHLSALHGLNPLGIVYLSNTGDLGAEYSVTELYHFRYGDGSVYDSDSNDETSLGPAPGYLVGGPNASYSGQLSDALGQAPARSYADDDTVSDAARTWELSEPAIYYQSAYVALLSGVMAANGDIAERESANHNTTERGSANGGVAHWPDGRHHLRPLCG